MDGLHQKKATILIVDDSPDSIALMDAMLKDRYRVKAAITGDRALAIALGVDPPDLILLDVMMPGLDGYETCRRLKGDPKSSGIPVIFLSAKSDAADESRARDLGAQGFLTKPPDPSIVMGRIAALLGKKAS